MFTHTRGRELLMVWYHYGCKISAFIDGENTSRAFHVYMGIVERFANNHYVIQISRATDNIKTEVGVGFKTLEIRWRAIERERVRECERVSERRCGRCGGDGG